MRTVKDPSSFRTNLRNRLAETVGSLPRAANLEIGVYNYAVGAARDRCIVRKWDNAAFVLLYVDRLRTIYRNLASNSELLQRITSGELPAKALAAMSHEEMRPGRWATVAENKRMRDKNRYAPQIDANTDNFTCGRCKSKRCSYYQLQTRSADEPMTTFVTCIDCGNRWKC